MRPSADLVGVYRRHTPTIGLRPTPARLIPRLRGRYLGVVTDGPLESQRAKAHAVGAPRWSSAGVYTAELGPGFGKPHPLAPSRCTQIAAGRAGRGVHVRRRQPTKDFAGPKSLGWATVRIRRPGIAACRAPERRDVDLEIASLDELPIDTPIA